MDKSQLGRAGELALSLYALVTSDGRLELFSPLVDDDHVDLIGGIRGNLPNLAIQVKTADGVDADRLVEARAVYRRGHVREHPSFLYSVLLLDAVAIHTAWLVPSPDFNRLAYHVASGRDHEALEFRASPTRDDVFTPFRVPPADLGRMLVAKAETGTAPEWLPALMPGC